MNTSSPAGVDNREIIYLTLMSAQGWPISLEAEELLSGSSRPTHPAAQALPLAHMLGAVASEM